MNIKSFKKLTAILLALLMVVCFTACKSKEVQEPEAEDPQQEEFSEAEEDIGEDVEEEFDEELEEEKDDDVTTGAGQQAPRIGGWEVYGDTPAVELPDDVQEAFDDVTSSLSGSTLTPIAYFGTQLVSGNNYEVLCINTPDEAPDEKELQVLVIYRDLDGNAELIGGNVFKIDTYVQGSGSEIETDITGGWELPEDFTVAEIPQDAQAAFDKAMEGFTGNSLTPLVYLGSQIVEGTNYAFLCHSALVTGDPIETIQVVIVSAAPDGNATIANIYTLDLASFNE